MGLGSSMVSGRSRVPNPPAMMTAFEIFIAHREAYNLAMQYTRTMALNKEVD
jgi:hypothetical protein